jgi:hypothetical protein
MKIRNSRIWRSDSVRGDTTENSIRIELGESDPAPAIKITKAEITIHIQKRQFAPNFWRKLSFKHAKNHEGKS